MATRTFFISDIYTFFYKKIAPTTPSGGGLLPTCCEQTSDLLQARFRPVGSLLVTGWKQRGVLGPFQKGFGRGVEFLREEALQSFLCLRCQQERLLQLLFPDVKDGGRCVSECLVLAVYEMYRVTI